VPSIVAGSSPPIVALTVRYRLLLLAILAVAAGVRTRYLVHGLGSKRFFDERYTFANVRPIVERGEIEVVSTFYPSPVVSVPPALLLRASNELRSRLHEPALLAMRRNGGVTQTGYLLARLLTMLYGLATIVATAAIGRRLFAPAVGLLAAWIVAWSPLHILASAYFKPDTLLGLGVTLTLLASLAAFARPASARYLAVGLTVALAMSAKMLGGLAALPLAIATVLFARRDRRRLVLLGVAGLMAMVTFVALNPRAPEYFGFLSALGRDYAHRAAAAGMTHLDVPRLVLELVASTSYHGALAGGASLVALVLLGTSAFRAGLAQEQRAGRLMIAVFPLVFTTFYAVQTAYFKANNFVSLVPFTALALSWLVFAAGARLSRGWPALARPVAAGSALAALLVGLALPGLRHVYLGLVPTTYDVATAQYRSLPPAEGRYAYVESATMLDRYYEVDRHPSALQARVYPVDSLAGLDPDQIALADGYLFRAEELERSGAHRELLTGRTRRIKAELFVCRGPELIDGRPAEWLPAPSRELRSELCPWETAYRELILPTDVRPGDVVSVQVWLGRSVERWLEHEPALELPGRTIRLHGGRGARRGRMYQSERIRIRPGDHSVHLQLGSRAVSRPGRVTVQLLRWRRR